MRTAAAVTALVLWMAVSGCSSDEAEPSTLPAVPSASDGHTGVPSPSVVSPTASATQEPPPAHIAPTAPTIEGAGEFARHYVRLIGEAFASADASSLRTASAPGCEGCDAIISAVDSLQPEGLRRVGGGYSVIDVAIPPVENGDVVLLLTYARAASEIVDYNGAVVDTAPAVPPTTAQMRLIHRQGEWVVQGYRVV